MLKNYLRIAFRNLLKRKGYTFINIIGLAIGIACCLLISIYVFNELSYDRFHEKADRIYRVAQTHTSPNREEKSAGTPFRTGPTLESEYPQLVETSVRFFNMQDPELTLIRHYKKDNQQSYRESNFYFTDSTFFNVFSAPLLRGNPDQALTKPLTIVLSESTATKYFGDEDPIGKTLTFKGIREMTVTGIMEDFPENSHMKIDVLASFTSLDDIFPGGTFDDSWWWNPCWTYVLLKEDAGAKELSDQFPGFVEKYYAEDRPEGEGLELNLQPVTDIYLYSNMLDEMEPTSSILYIYLFTVVAILILIIACINFMNLATARSVERSREVGMRKVLGAERPQLFFQFMGESFLMSFMAIVLSVVFIQGMLPAFNSFLDLQLAFNPLQNPVILIGLFILFVVVGLLAGLYPAVYLSGFRPASVLKGEVTKGSRGALFRKGLVVFQFSLSVILIIGTIIVYLQLQHMQTKKLGFDKEQVIILPTNQNLIAWEFDQFKERALSNPAIKSVTGSEEILGLENQNFYKFFPANKNAGEETSNLGLHVKYDFFETYNINIVAGRAFSEEFSTDSARAILINEKMVSQLGYNTPTEALGEPFYFYDSDTGENDPLTVIGVVEDFNYTSIKSEIKPMVIRLIEGIRPTVAFIGYAAVKVAPGGVPQALEHLEKVWNEINWVDPFEYSFHDEELNQIYAGESKMSKIAGAFSSICILVACLGLFGLASFTSSQRTKEIGIRKTLGASVSGIVMLLSKEYIKLVLIANVIAWPVIYFLVSLWLQDFPYRITLGLNLFMVFALSAVLSLVICLITVSYQSVKAALINPVESIKQE